MFPSLVIFRKDVLVAASAHSTFVKVQHPIVVAGVSIWVCVPGYAGMGVVEEEEKEIESEENYCLPYCKFEEGTPGHPALSNQAH